MVNKSVRIFLRELNKEKNLQNTTITCGFSGGPDSTALLLALHEAAPHYKYQLSATFFHHGSNCMAANEDEALDFCQDFCDKHNIRLKVVYLDLKKERRLGWESSARKLRNNHYKKENYDFIFLGHHQDDQNETTLMQLFRGGQGVTGMRSINNKICRPLLDLHKTDIIVYLESKGISYIQDKSNENTDLTRNYWRNLIIPKISTVYPNYSRQLANFRKQTKELHDLSKELAKVDGLESLIAGQSVCIQNLSKLRLKNLIKHFFLQHNIYKENNYYEQLVAHYTKNKELLNKVSCFTIHISENTVSITK